MKILAKLRDVAIIGACLWFFVVTWNFTELFGDNARALVANTKPPVAIRLDGFSPEAQRVFDAAVKPKQKGR